MQFYNRQHSNTRSSDFLYKQKSYTTSSSYPINPNSNVQPPHCLQPSQPFAKKKHNRIHTDNSSIGTKGNSIVHLNPHTIPQKNLPKRRPSPRKAPDSRATQRGYHSNRENKSSRPTEKSRPHFPATISQAPASFISKARHSRPHY
jgi:hypothetical protein